MEKWYVWWTAPKIRFANISADELSGISVPTIIIPGDNNAHPRHTGQELHVTMSNSHLCDPVELLPDEINGAIGKAVEDHSEQGGNAAVLRIAALAPIIAGFVGGLECQPIH